jgi:hypothetical protein
VGCNVLQTWAYTGYWEYSNGWRIHKPGQAWGNVVLYKPPSVQIFLRLATAQSRQQQKQRTSLQLKQE